MRRIIVDTTATILFFTILASFSELVIAGIPWQRVLTTRLIMIPVMIVTGRPYGLYRDWWIRFFKPSSPMARTMIDILAFLTFQVPVYMATLLYAGASWTETIASVGSALILMVFVGRPFGLFLDFARRKAGVAAAEA